MISIHFIQSWLNDLLQKERSKDVFLTTSYFELLMVEVRLCNGCETTGGPHVEITDSPRGQAMVYINTSDCEKFHGNFAKYCTELFSMKKTAIWGRPCWRSHGGKLLCLGTQSDYDKLVLLIPVSFCVEIEDEFRNHPTIEQQFWNLPVW